MQVNRLVNCETSNLNRAIDAAQRQLADIKFLRSRKVKLNELLEEAVTIRLKFPDCTIGELAKKIFVTKQALLHRFKLIHQIAEKIKSEEKGL